MVLDDCEALPAEFTGVGEDLDGDRDLADVFNARRAAILLIGGRKIGGARWYERYVPLAEKIYEQHLKDLENEQGG